MFLCIFAKVVPLGPFGVLGVLLGGFGDLFEVTMGSLWDPLAVFVVLWGLLWIPLGTMFLCVFTGGVPLGSFWHLWCVFGCLLAVIWGPLGVPLGSLWHPFGCL